MSVKIFKISNEDKDNFVSRSITPKKRAFKRMKETSNKIIVTQRLLMSL